MFAIGSSLVKDDIDVFWCTDMDEFFDVGLINEVEIVFENTETMTIIIPHIIFWKNEKFIFSHNDGTDTHPFPFARITKHVPGRIYGHCTLQKYTPVQVLDNYVLYHFAFVGDRRMSFKSTIYSSGSFDGYGWYENVWETFNPKDVPEDGSVSSIKYHPSLPLGVKRSPYKIPSYINVTEMITNLYND